MNPARAISSRSLLLLLLSALPGLAASDTWDGNAPNGGTLDSNISTNLNWADDIAPVSDLNFTDLIFGGATKLSPNFTTAFSVRSVTFNNTAGAFTLGGAQLSVGATGITNNDTTVQTFNSAVTFAGVANSSVNAVSGQLVFTKTITLPSSNLTVNTAGAQVKFDQVNGTGTVTKNGFGKLVLSSGAVQSFDLIINAGTVDALGGLFTTFDSNASVNVISGSLEVPPTAVVSLDNTPVTVQSGGNLNVYGVLNVAHGADVSKTGDMVPVFDSGTINVTGAGSTLGVSGVLYDWGDFVEDRNISVSSGGRVTAGGLNVYLASFLVDGAGSDLTVTGPTVMGADNTAVISFTKGASGALGDLTMSPLPGPGASVVSVHSGSTLTTGSLNLSAALDGSAQSTVTVSGAGSTVIQNGAATLSVGTAAGRGTLQLTGGGRFSTGTGSVKIAGQGAVTLDGGTFVVRGPLSVTDGGTLQFNAGQLSIVDNFNVGSGGLFGSSFSLNATQSFSTSGASTIDAFSLLTLNGGTFSTGSLTNNGAIAFNSGTLAVTGGGGFVIGGAGALGANVALDGDSALQITSTATVAAGAVLTLEDGLFTAGALSNSGTVRIRSGIAAAGSGANHSGGRIFAADVLDVSGAFTNAAGSRLTLEDGAGLLMGAGVLTNAGLLTGDGTVAKPLTNSAAGEVRGESGRTLFFSAPAVNDGRFTLTGGSLDFSAAVTNAATGYISGYGSLYTGGLTNSGQMAFAGGTTGLYGDVSLTPGSRVATSGAGAVTVFYDDMVHNGQEIYTGTGASTVFYGAQSGSGSFTGGGTVYFIGDLRPGNSPAVVTYAPEVVLTDFNELTVEIGGRTPGAGTPANNGYDKMIFSRGALPQVTWNGALVIDLINDFTPAAGDTFDIFDFNPGGTAGAFTSIKVRDHGLLPGGLGFDFSELYTTGVIKVTALPALTFAAWAETVLNDPEARPSGDHDGDGLDNATEYALGLFPSVPETVSPSGGLHQYPDGASMRLLFTRPLDRSDVTLRVQVSSDLTTWEDLAVSVNSAPFSGPGFVSEDRAHPIIAPGLVEVRDIRNATGERRRYLRLLITLSP